MAVKISATGPAAPVSNAMRLRDSMWNAAQKISFGQGLMMAQSSGPFFTVFMSAVSPPWRSSHYLHCLRVVGQHIGGGPIVRHLDAERVGRVEMGRVKAEACARGAANPVERDNAEHQRAGRVADPVNDDALTAVADGGVF